MSAFLKRFAPGRAIPRPSAQRCDRAYEVASQLYYGVGLASANVGCASVICDASHYTQKHSEAAGLEVEFTSPTQWQVISSFSLTVAAVGGATVQTVVALMRAASARAQAQVTSSHSSELF
eukprot:4280715-Amphidinium_carterae.1